MSHTAPNAGFSMAETIIVVIIMAILAGLSAPAFIEFLDRQTAQAEANAMEEIREALEVFVERHNRLPEHTDANNGFCNNAPNSWAHCLATVSNLSVAQLTTDAWGRPRTYVAAVDNTNVLFGEVVPMYYATVVSRGRDLSAETAPGIATAIDGIFTIHADVTDGDWWAQVSQNQLAGEFDELEAAGDDYLIKFSTRQLSMENYETTLARISSISNALTSYATAKYNEALIVSEADAERKTYFPLALPDTVADANANYGDEVRNDMTATMFGTDQRVENRAGSTGLETTRRTEMINLMRLLGLPDSFCCNALERNPFDQTEERALFYYSNPRAQTGAGGCFNARANITQDAPRYLPARISAVAYPCP